MNDEDVSTWQQFLKSNGIKKIDNKDTFISHKTIDYQKALISKQNLYNKDTLLYESINQTFQKQYEVQPVSSSYFKKANIQGKLDLHGMNQEIAYRALTQFFTYSQHEHRKYAVIITGKGNSEKGSVLKPLFKKWANENSHLIVAHSPAPPQYGGDGAYLVHIRKDRII